MNVIINIDTTLDPSGGTNDEVIETYSGRNQTGSFQWEVAGASTAVDVHLESRLKDRFGWEDLIPAETGVSGASGFHTSLDLDDIDQLRVRVVNQDATAGNTADVDAVVALPR